MDHRIDVVSAQDVENVLDGLSDLLAQQLVWDVHTAPPLITDAPVIAGRDQVQGDVYFAATTDPRPHWAQAIGSGRITLVESGNGHVLSGLTRGSGRVLWAPGGAPADEHVIGFLEVIGGPNEAVAVITQPGADGGGTRGHKRLAIGIGRYWVCRQMSVTPRLTTYRVVD